MSDVHNHEHAKENKGVGPASSLRTVIGVIVSIIAVCLVMSTIFPTAMYGWEPSYRYRHVNENQRYSPDNTRARQVMVRSSFGGDEFVAFLVGANDDAVIEAKREALSSLIAEASHSLGVPIALSVGVARYPQDGATYQELFDAADRAMYDEKNEGRVEDSV